MKQLNLPRKRNRLTAIQYRRRWPEKPARSMLRSWGAANRHCSLYLAMARRRGWNPKALREQA